MTNTMDIHNDNMTRMADLDLRIYICGSISAHLDLSLGGGTLRVQQMTSNHELRIKDLERRLASVTQERNDLQKDVEALCLSSGSSMFSRSFVLTERIKAVDSELQESR